LPLEISQVKFVVRRLHFRLITQRKTSRPALHVYPLLRSMKQAHQARVSISDPALVLLCNWAV
jgi:hypothetical protein